MIASTLDIQSYITLPKSIASHAWEDVEIATLQTYLLAHRDSSQPSLLHSQTNICVIESYVTGSGKRELHYLGYQYLCGGGIVVWKRIFNKIL